MKNLKLENFSSLLHTDWHPEKGDFIKENSLQDSEQFNNRIKKHNMLAISLVLTIIVVFICSIVVVSL